MKSTQIIYSDNLNQLKFEQLNEIAQRLGKLRKQWWHEFGSFKGIYLNHRMVRDQYLEQKHEFNVPARLWKETLRQVFSDINMYYKASQKNVVQAIYRKYDSETQQDRIDELCKKLYSNQWYEDKYLHRLMRKYYKHGKTSVNNQIVLDSDCYEWFEFNGKGWIEVMSLIPRKRIAIPLNSTHGAIVKTCV